MFKFKIYGKHERQEFSEEGELIFTPISEEWHKFDQLIDLDYVTILSFRSYVLFDSEENPTPCTMVCLSDGSILFAVNKVETFEANYLEYRIKRNTVKE